MGETGDGGGWASSMNVDEKKGSVSGALTPGHWPARIDAYLRDLNCPIPQSAIPPD